MLNFDTLLQTLREDLTSLALDFGEGLIDDLVDAGCNMAENTREDLLRWSEQLAGGELSEEDFRFLLESRKDLLELEALKQKGLAQADLDRLKNAVVDTIIGSVRKAL